MRTLSPRLLLLLFSVLAAAQEPARFVGTWKGLHAGKPYLTLTVAAGDPFRVSLVTAGIHIGDTGEIDRIDGPVEHEEKVLESKLADGKLRIRTEQPGGQIIEYEMTLDGEAALLRIVDEPYWVKPFRLTR